MTTISQIQNIYASNTFGDLIRATNNGIIALNVIGQDDWEKSNGSITLSNPDNDTCLKVHSPVEITSTVEIDGVESSLIVGNSVTIGKTLNLINANTQIPTLIATGYIGFNDLDVTANLTANNLVANNITFNHDLDVSGNLVVKKDITGNTFHANTIYLKNVSIEDIGGKITIQNDVSDSTLYPLLSKINSGILETANTSSTKLTFNPSSGTLTAKDFSSSSDEKLKTNVHKLFLNTQILNSLNPVGFDWKDSGKKSYGLIAQEVEKILPDIVSDIDGTKNINYQTLIAFLIGAVQELSSRIEELESYSQKND